MQGKYSLETFARERKLTKQAALNLLSKLRKQGYVQVDGGGRQKRIYTLSEIPQQPANGFYEVVNKYSPDKLVPKFKHIVYGRYTIEQAIIDGIKIGDIRTLEAVEHLFLHLNSWKRLFVLAKKHRLVSNVYTLYEKARKKTKVKKMPKRYRKND